LVLDAGYNEPETGTQNQETNGLRQPVFIVGVPEFPY
jgi:hypothetical protein